MRSFIGYASDQWVDSGFGVTATVECDDRYFYMSLEEDDDIDNIRFMLGDQDWDDPDGYFNETKQYCQKYGTKRFSCIEAVDHAIKSEFGDTDHGAYYDEDTEEYVVY